MSTGRREQPPSSPLLQSEPDPYALAHPQEMYRLVRGAGAVVDLEGTVLVAGDEQVREVLRHPEVFSSGIDAAHIGQIRPLIPLQIDPPDHKNYRKILDPLFAPKRVATLEDHTRALVGELIAAVVDDHSCNFNKSVAEPLPTTVFLELLGLPVSRREEFIALKDGIIRPPGTDIDKRKKFVDETGQKIYAVLEEVVTAREAEPKDDFISGFLTAEVDGHTLTHDEVVDIGYLFFLAGLDTVTASLDCFVAYLARHDEHRRALVDDPGVIPDAVEELLRWETPVAGVVRITTTDTELGGCPIAAHTPVAVMLGSANTDEAAWPDAETVDFQRPDNKHLAFGGGAHRCLGSHLARMELRVALEEWHAAVPDYAIRDGIELNYSQGLRQIENLELVW
ncbi:MAG: cytochrome P450 [Acidimicrobiia bacterium]|nr:cytochrome P450 [Acidimicrobiia bacterium]MBV9039529.1 cytochrome P450 [Acidimicrobiia bacterium]